jgi:nucleotide-binding universal stress UspA family protein
MGQQTREAVLSGLSEAAGSMRPAVRRLRLVLREGDPSAEILHFAERQDVDLISMGTHGRRGFDGSFWVLSSSVCAEKRHAPC